MPIATVRIHKIVWNGNDGEVWYTDPGGAGDFLRTILGLEPRGDDLSIDPWLPTGIERVELHGVPGRWGRADAVARPVASMAGR